MKKIRFPIIILIFLVLIGAYAFRSKANTDQSFQQEQVEQTKIEEVANTSKKYINYSPSATIQAAKNGKALLFFHADWCPTCRAAEKDILNQMDQVPADLTIIKTNYDKEKDLKKKYGVTYQHTFVQVDKDGEMIIKWSGGSLKEIVARVK